jgi:hypothetical protein
VPIGRLDHHNIRILLPRASRLLRALQPHSTLAATQSRRRDRGMMGRCNQSRDVIAAINGGTSDDPIILRMASTIETDRAESSV